VSIRQSFETAAQVTTPVPVSVSGLTFLGVTFQDWVFIATAILVVFQLIVIIPKAVNILKSPFKRNKHNDCE